MSLLFVVLISDAWVALLELHKVAPYKFDIYIELEFEQLSLIVCRV